MGKGTDAVRLDSPEHAALIDDLKEQLLIVFLKRLGGRIDIAVEEIDDTGQDTFKLSLDPKTRIFHFELGKKQ